MKHLFFILLIVVYCVSKSRGKRAACEDFLQLEEFTKEAFDTTRGTFGVCLKECNDEYPNEIIRTEYSRESTAGEWNLIWHKRYCSPACTYIYIYI